MRIRYILFFLIAVSWLTRAMAGEVPLFRFVQASDLHYVATSRLATAEWVERSAGQRKFVRVPHLLDQLAAWAQAESIDLAILTGDLFETPAEAAPAWPELSAALDRLGCPWFAVLGNHDYGVERALPPDAVRHGLLDFAFSFGGIRFAGITTTATLFSGPVDVVPEATLEGLAADREAHPEQPLVILAHTPLYPGAATPSWGLPANAGSVRDVLERAGPVVLTLQGHLHAFTRDRHRGIAYVTAPALVQEPHQFVLWSVYPDRLEGRLVSLAGRTAVADAAEPSVVMLDARLRGTLRRPKRPYSVVAQPLPVSQGVLAKWFGAGWSYFPGTTPVHLERESIVIPRQSTGWKQFRVETRNATPPMDASGRAWYESDYDDSGWRNAILPVGYGPRRNLAAPVAPVTEVKPNRGVFLRRRLPGVPAVAERRVQGLLRVASDKSAKVYLNGILLDEDPASHFADYWNRSVVFDRRLLNGGTNILSVHVRNDLPSSHQFFDLELAVGTAR